MKRDWRQTYREWLMKAALPLWSQNGVDRHHGGFHELLGQEGAPVPAPRRARVQGRQSFVFAYAAGLGWDGPWREIAPMGLDYLERFYLLPDGLYATLAGPDGVLIDQTAMTYDQAFAMLAAASLHMRDPENGRWHDFARRLMKRVEELRRHSQGGFLEAGGKFLSNPHMHLLEAALAWVEAGGGAYWEGLAREIADLALCRFILRESGVLLEHFDASWAPAPGDAGSIVEPGHLFEWSWLLARWARLGGGERAQEAALMLFATGQRGVDLVRNVALDETDHGMRPRRATARLWPQTERLKAALQLGHEAEADAAAAGLWNYLQTPRAGLWRDKMREDGGFVEEPAPASTLYHVICAVAAFPD